jgi:hypothetical protein
VSNFEELSPSDTALVLLGLRLSGLAETAAAGSRWAISEAAAGNELASLESRGLVTFRSGRITGWALSAEGRTEGERLLREQLDEAGARTDVEASYDDFLPHNREFLTLCTDWQMRGGPTGELNDHTDAEYDAGVVARLVELHSGVVPVVDRVAQPLERFAMYRPRLTTALSRVQAGELDWFTKPLIESYHTIWFELHEDFLATLGRTRESETS